MVVTVTATNPSGTVGSDGGNEVITLTETEGTITGSNGMQSYIVAVSVQQVCKKRADRR